jgi:hypothetical protein
VKLFIKVDNHVASLPENAGDPCGTHVALQAVSDEIVAQRWRHDKPIETAVLQVPYVIAEGRCFHRSIADARVIHIGHMLLYLNFHSRSAVI